MTSLEPWDTGKAVLREKFTVLQIYLKKQEKAQIHNLTLHLKKLEKINKAQSEQKKGNYNHQSRNKQKCLKNSSKYQ